MKTLPDGWEKTKDETARFTGSREIVFRNESLDEGGFVNIVKSSNPAVVDAGEAGMWRVKTSMYNQVDTFDTKNRAVSLAKKIMRSQNKGEDKYKGFGGLY